MIRIYQPQDLSHLDLTGNIANHMEQLAQFCCRIDPTQPPKVSELQDALVGGLHLDRKLLQEIEFPEGDWGMRSLIEYLHVVNINVCIPHGMLINFGWEAGPLITLGVIDTTNVHQEEYFGQQIISADMRVIVSNDNHPSVAFGNLALVDRQLCNQETDAFYNACFVQALRYLDLTKGTGLYLAHYKQALMNCGVDHRRYIELFGSDAYLGNHQQAARDNIFMKKSGGMMVEMMAPLDQEIYTTARLLQPNSSFRTEILAGSGTLERKSFLCGSVKQYGYRLGGTLTAMKQALDQDRHDDAYLRFIDFLTVHLPNAQTMGDMKDIPLADLREQLVRRSIWMGLKETEGIELPQDIFRFFNRTSQRGTRGELALALGSAIYNMDFLNEENRRAAFA